MYSATGNAWPAPQLITISFIPDGTIVAANDSGYVGSNLYAKFNAKFGSAPVWQNIILKAAQSWAQQTNINFALVTDDGSDTGSSLYQQGDPNKGDIRISGFNFGNSNLASAVLPPPINNYSAAGDINFNTNQIFNNGSTYDLFSVAAHEIGHSLGLGHSTVTNAEMFAIYNGVKPSLSTDDVAGIRSIYSGGAARAPDVAGNGSISTATNLTSQIDATSLTAVVTGLDLTTTTDKDYYTFTAPAGTASSLTVAVQSQGLSLLSPKLTVYAADGTTVLGSAGTTGQYGTTIQVTVTNVGAGQQFYVKVAGADTTPFGTGAYAMTLNLGTGATPAVPLPYTTLANGDPFSAGGGLPELAQVTKGDDVHSDALSSGAEDVTSGFNPFHLQKTISGASEMAALNPVALSTLFHAELWQTATLPSGASQGIFEFHDRMMVLPAHENFNSPVVAPAPIQLLGAGESQRLPTSDEGLDMVLPIGVESDQPTS